MPVTYIALLVMSQNATVNATLGIKNYTDNRTFALSAVIHQVQ